MLIGVATLRTIGTSQSTRVTHGFRVRFPRGCRPQIADSPLITTNLRVFEASLYSFCGIRGSNHELTPRLHFRPRPLHASKRRPGVALTLAMKPVWPSAFVWSDFSSLISVRSLLGTTRRSVITTTAISMRLAKQKIPRPQTDRQIGSEQECLRVEDWVAVSESRGE
jgi:hypothetical protein